MASEGWITAKLVSPNTEAGWDVLDIRDLVLR